MGAARAVIAAEGFLEQCTVRALNLQRGALPKQTLLGTLGHRPATHTLRISRDRISVVEIRHLGLVDCETHSHGPPSSAWT